jgi:hypothetical protein
MEEMRQRPKAEATASLLLKWDKIMTGRVTIKMRTKGKEEFEEVGKSKATKLQ